MKKKIEIEIKNESGEVTFYHQMVTTDSKQVKIPLGEILKLQKNGKRDPKKPVH